MPNEPSINCRKYVDSLHVVVEGLAINIDDQAASEALQEAQKRSPRAVPRLDWAGSNRRSTRANGIAHCGE